MNLFDLIKPKKNVNTQPIQLVQATPNAEGGLDAQVTEWQPRPTRAQNIRSKLTDLLFGEAAPSTDNIGTGNGQPITMRDELTGEEVTYTPQNTSTVSENPRVGGLFRDLGAGARENFATGFAANNLLDNTTDDGRRKGFAYRLGEGLGSVGRFLESTPGRGLLTAAAVGLAGGNGADMLAYGLQSSALNNRLRTQDRMYREEMYRNSLNSLQNSPEFMMLNDSEKQAIINNLKSEINNTRGYVTDDVYKNLVTAQQLRDNADYRNLMANLQMQNNEAVQNLRKDQLEFQKQKENSDKAFRSQQLALTARGQDMNYGAKIAGIYAKRAEEERKAAEKAYAKAEETNNIIHQLDVLQGLHKRLPQNYVPTGGKKTAAVLAGLATKAGIPNNDMAAFNGAQNIVTNMIARKIGGEKGVMTDRDFERAKAMTPNIFDTPAQAEAKVKSIYALMNVPYHGTSSGAKPSKGTTKIGNYTVRVK